MIPLPTSLPNLLLQRLVPPLLPKKSPTRPRILTTLTTLTTILHPKKVRQQLQSRAQSARLKTTVTIPVLIRTMMTIRPPRHLPIPPQTRSLRRKRQRRRTGLMTTIVAAAAAAAAATSLRDMRSPHQERGRRDKNERAGTQREEIVQRLQTIQMIMTIQRTKAATAARPMGLTILLNRTILMTRTLRRKIRVLLRRKTTRRRDKQGILQRKREETRQVRQQRHGNRILRSRKKRRGYLVQESGTRESLSVA